MPPADDDRRLSPRRDARPSARCRSTTSHPPAKRHRPRRQPGAPDRRTPDTQAAAPASTTRPAPDTLRELAFLDRINEIGARRPARRRRQAAAALRRGLRDPRAARPRRARAARRLIGRAALPGRAPRTVIDRLVKLYRHGLIARHTTGLREHTSTDGKPPLLYSLTRRGLEVAQQREPAPAISPQTRMAADRAAARRPPRARPARPRLGDRVPPRSSATLATDHWRTPRYATGRYPVPQAGSGRDRHPITLNEIPVPDGQAIIDLELKTFTEIKPDLSLELRIETLKLTFDLLVELDLTARPSYNRDKFLAYDAFLCGWSLAHPRYRAQGTRPAVVFVCPDRHAALALRARGRRADDRTDRRHGHPRRALVLRRPRPHCSSPSRPTSTTASCRRSRCRRSRPGYANGSPEAASSRSTG